MSFVPETGLRDLINKPFAHFQSVLLNDDVHFEDLPDEGSVSEVNEEGEEISEAISDDERMAYRKRKRCFRKLKLVLPLLY